MSCKECDKTDCNGYQCKCIYGAIFIASAMSDQFDAMLGKMIISEICGLENDEPGCNR